MSEDTEQAGGAYQPETWVCLGRRRGSKGKMAICLQRVVDNVLSGPVLTFEYKQKQHGRLYAGGMYTVEVDRSGGNHVLMARLPGAAYLQPWGREEDRIEWRAIEQAELAVERREKQREADAKDDPMLRRLLPLRRAYHKTDRLGKLALLIKVIEYIQTRE